MVNTVVLSNPKAAFSKTFDRKAYYDRRRLLYRMLGGVCSSCGAKLKKRGKSNLHIHHVFYLFGEPMRDFQWGSCSEDDFWNIFFPEIMESCVLLCVRCHEKAHRVKKGCFRKYDSYR